MNELAEGLQRRVGERVRSLRTDRGLTQRQLADRVCVSRPSIANVEAGRQNVGLRQLCALAGALGVGIAELVAEVGGGAAE